VYVFQNLQVGASDTTPPPSYFAAGEVESDTEDETDENEPTLYEIRSLAIVGVAFEPEQALFIPE
jgi:hypothetical protein